MAIVSDIEIRLRADIAQLRNDLRRAQGEVSGSINNIKKTLLSFAAGFSVGQIVSEIVRAQREFDKLNASLITATGSSKNAGEAMKALQSFAASTPYSLQEVTEGFLKLRNLGLTPSERALSSYGNTASAMGKSLTQLVEAVADATTGEFERLKEFGIKSKQQGDMVAFTFQGTTTKIKNNSADIEEYLMRIGEVNFAGGMALQADTLDGAISALGDTWDQTLVAFSQSGFGDAVRTGIVALSGALTDLQAIFKAVGGAAKDEGEQVKETSLLHQGLTTFFEAITVLGVNVAYVFKTIGKDIGAFAAQAATLFNGGIAGLTDGSTLKAIRAIGEARVEEGKKERAEVDATSERILGAAAKAKEARDKEAAELKASGKDRLAQYKIQAEAAQGLTDAQIKAAEKAAKEEGKRIQAYRELESQVQARVDSSARELEGLAELSEAEQFAIKLAEDLRLGKVKLTKAEQERVLSLNAEASANSVLAKSNKAWNDLQQKLADNAAELAQERGKLIESAKEEVKQNEFLAQTLGMTEDAVIRLQAARLLEQEAQRLGRDLTQEEIEDLQKVIELKERSAKAVASKRELEEAKQFWTDIDKTARDTFVSIADGGKNTFQRLKDTAKNVFFDWLYQQTLKKWIINIVASVSGAAGISGIAQAAGAGGGGIGEAFGLASSANSLYGALTGGATLAGGLGTGFLGSLAGGLNGAGIGSGLTSAIGLNIGNSIAGVVGSNVASGIATGLSGLAAAAPWVAGASAVYTIGKKAFGRGPKEFSGNSSIEGMFGASGLDAKQYVEWTKKGGWFRSDKSGRDPMELGAETTAALTTAYDAIKTSSAQYAEALGLNADSIMNRTQAINISLGKDEAANQQAIADFFTGVADTVAGEILPNIAQFQQAGESAATTLQRVAVNFTAVEQILMALGTDSQTAFRAVGVASLEARERLVALTGGIESFAQQASFFNQNFLTQAEQIAIIQGPLNKRLEELGYAGITTTEQFKTAVQGLVSSGALATEEGAKLYAGLLAVAPQFKTVADYLKELSDAAAETAENAKAAADALLAQNEASLRSAIDSAFNGVQTAVQAQRDRLTGEFEALMEGIGRSIETVSGRVSDLTRLSDAIAGARGSVTSDAQQAASRMSARAQVQTAIAIAKASGVLPSADDLKDALSVLSQDAGDQFSTLADYQREVARTNLELDTLGGLTEKQLSDAQRQLEALEDQKSLLERQHQEEMERLDSILEKAQAQIDAINGVNTTTLSLLAAIATLNVAIQGLKQGATPSNPTGGNLSLTDLYQTVLGRAPDAAGYEFWKNAYGENFTGAQAADFIKAAQPELEAQERLRRQAEAASMSSSGTMSSSSANGAQDMSRMEALLARSVAANEQLAAQFNQVTAGGNAMLSEPA